MMPHEPTSLTPDERELAQRLARLGPHGEPSPALDARILAAAHASTARAPVRLTTRPLTARWPMALGLAASLVLAVGLAWRLRPLPETRPAYRSEAVSAVQAVAPPAQAPVATASDMATQPSPVAQATVESSAVESSTFVTQPQARGPAPQRSHDAMQATAPPPAPEPAVVLDEARPQAASKAAGVLASPPAPTPADAPQAFGTSAPPAATSSTSDAATTSDDRQTHAAAAEANQAAKTPDAAAAQSARGDEPLDDVPPATADSPAVRDAWLQRIRDLIDDGNVDSARASLHAFVHRYPAYPVPADLRALER